MTARVRDDFLRGERTVRTRLIHQLAACGHPRLRAPRIHLDAHLQPVLVAVEHAARVIARVSVEAALAEVLDFAAAVGSGIRHRAQCAVRAGIVDAAAVARADDG